MEDLREFIARFERELPKEFVRVEKEVDPKYEISAMSKSWICWENTRWSFSKK